MANDKWSISQIHLLLADPTCSTIVENPLQIGLFMQNKPNFQKAKMNVSFLITRDYDNLPVFRAPKNKPNTKPNKPNFQRPKTNANSFAEKEL